MSAANRAGDVESYKKGETVDQFAKNEFYYYKVKLGPTNDFSAEEIVSRSNVRGNSK